MKAVTIYDSDIDVLEKVIKILSQIMLEESKEGIRVITRIIAIED